MIHCSLNSNCALPALLTLGMVFIGFDSSAHGQSDPSASSMVIPSIHTPGGSVREPLTLKAVVAMALSNNGDIQSADLDTLIHQEKIKSAMLDFDVHMDAGYLYQSIKSPQNAQDYVATGGGTATPFNPAQPILKEPNVFVQNNHIAKFGLRKKLEQGTILELGTTMRVLDNTLNSRVPPAIYNPEWETFTGLTVTQPLLQGWGKDANLAKIRIAKANAKTADLEWQLSTSQVVAEVMKRYYDVVFTLENLKVQRESIELARKLLDDTRARSKEGQVSPNEVLVAEAGVNQRIEDALAAEMLYIERQNALQLLFKTPEDVIARSSRVVPVDRLQSTAPVTNRNSMVQIALQHRYEVQQAEQYVAVKLAELDHATSESKARLDLVASAGLHGLASNGTRSYRRAVHTQGPEWTAGVQFSMPWSRDHMEAERRAAKDGRTQALIRRGDVRTRVALEVDTVISRLQSDQQRLAATRKSREAAAESAVAGLKRLNEGVTTSFEVLQLQREFSQARSREYAALADLNKDIVDLQLATGLLLEKQGVSLESNAAEIRQRLENVEIIKIPAEVDAGDEQHEIVDVEGDDEASRGVRRSTFSKSKRY